MATYDKRSPADPFLRRYEESELRIAAEFLDTWLPFLSRDLCRHCTSLLSRRVRSLSSESDTVEEASESGQDDSCVTTNNENCDTHSLGSWKDEAEANSVDNCKEEVNGLSIKEVTNSLSEVSPESAGGRASWADMAQEDELEGDRESDDAGVSSEQRYVVTRRRTELSRDQREYIRFMNVKHKKDFVCLERINGRIVNVVQGLELHTGVFSSVEQKRIVDYILELQEKGRRRELKERTYTAPKKWMRGKGRETIQFGCCYNYAVDKNGNPPGILRVGDVDPLPYLFKVMIKRLVHWHILPPSCVPDSCIVNIYEEGDCIPPHIDSHDFVRPFCTISLLSECSIVFGSELKIIGPGEFAGDHDIPLPMGSVLVLNGNGADVAKHCVPAVPTKRISITFRKMDEAKRPSGYMPEPDLQGLEPLCYNDKTPINSSPKQLSTTRRGFKSDANRSEEPTTPITPSIYRRGRSRGTPRSWGSNGR